MTQPNRKTFARFMKSETIAKYLAEAKRVGYSVKKTAETFIVKDEGVLVFQGLRKDQSIWVAVFSTLYWQEIKQEGDR